MSDDDRFSDQRRHMRHDIAVTCDLEFAGRGRTCSLLNVSVGGALIATEVLPEPGESVILRVDHMGAIEGTVVRSSATESAVRFDPDEAKALGINDMITFHLNRQFLQKAAV